MMRDLRLPLASFTAPTGVCDAPKRASRAGESGGLAGFGSSEEDERLGRSAAAMHTPA